MTRHPLQFVSEQDRLTYRTWMHRLAAVYGTILVLAIGLVAVRQNLGTHHAPNSVTIATLNQFDR